MIEKVLYQRLAQCLEVASEISVSLKLEMSCELTSFVRL